MANKAVGSGVNALFAQQIQQGVEYAFDASTQVMLGRYPDMSLSQAQSLAKAILLTTTEFGPQARSFIKDIKVGFKPHTANINEPFKNTTPLDKGSVLFNKAEGEISSSKPVAKTLADVAKPDSSGIIKVDATEKNKPPIWTDNPNKGYNNPKNAFEHSKKHLNDFPEIKNAKQYVEYAQNFLKNLSHDVEIFKRPDGDTMYYCKQSNVFIVTNSKGAPRTMMKPTDKYNYWLRQMNKYTNK